MSNLPIGIPYYITCELDVAGLEPGSQDNLNNFTYLLPEPLVLPYVRSWAVGLCQISCDFPSDVGSGSDGDIVYVFLNETVNSFNAGGCISVHTITPSATFKNQVSKTHFYEEKNIAFHALKERHISTFAFKLRRMVDGNLVDLFAVPKQKGAKVVITLAVAAMDVDRRTDTIPMIAGTLEHHNKQFPSNSAMNFEVALPPNISQVQHKNWCLGLSSATVPLNFGELQEREFGAVNGFRVQYRSSTHAVSSQESRDELTKLIEKHDLQMMNSAGMIDLRFDTAELNAVESGSCEDIIKYIAERSAATKVVKIMLPRPEPGRWYLQFNLPDNKLYKDVLVAFTRTFAVTFGIIKEDEHKDKTSIVRQYQTGLAFGYKFNRKAFVPSRAYVCCNSIEPCMVGSKMQRLLGVVPLVDGEGVGGHHTHTFPNVLYHRLPNRTTSSLQFSICNSNGSPLMLAGDPKKSQTMLQTVLQITK